MTMTVDQLADLIQTQQRQRLARDYSQEQAGREITRVTPARKYTKIDRGQDPYLSGFLMIENATGAIYGIQGYGKVDKRHYYGTLDTAAQWHWGDYAPRKIETEENPDA